MLPEYKFLTETTADSILIDGKWNMGVGYNSILLFIKNWRLVKEGMNQTVDNKGNQHHYLSQSLYETDEKYVDFKEY